MSSEGEEAQEEASTSQPSPQQRGGAKLFLGGLSWNTTEEKLREHFGRYGDIVEAVVMRDRQTGRPRGFGFVTFTMPEAADRVVEDIHVIDGRQIDAKKSVPQELKPKARKVFVGGLAPEVTEEEFRRYFGRYGTVVEAQIMQDHMSGRSRGFGFITFEHDESAEAVFQAGAMHDLGGKKVEVKPATPKGSGSQAQRIAGGPGGGGGTYSPGGRGGFRGSAYAQAPGGRGGPGGAYPPVGSPPVGPAAYGYGVPYGYSPGMMAAGPAGYGLSYPLQNPYMMMQQISGYPAPHQAYAYPTGYPQPTMMTPQPPGGRGGAGQQHPQQQQPYGGPGTPVAGPGGGGGLRGGGGSSGGGGTPYSPSFRQPQLQRQPSLGKNGNGSRSKVDSASSLDMHATTQQFKSLSME